MSGARVQQHRIRVAPYEEMFPDQPIRWVLGDHTNTVEVWFKDGTRLVIRKVEDTE